MATTSIPKRSMRNQPTGNIADFSANLKLTYSMDIAYASVVDTPEFKAWEATAVAKLARQGKNFELTGTVDGVSITVRGKRI